MADSSRRRNLDKRQLNRWSLPSNGGEFGAGVQLAASDDCLTGFVRPL